MIVNERIIDEMNATKLSSTKLSSDLSIGNNVLYSRKTVLYHTNMQTMQLSHQSANILICKKDSFHHNNHTDIILDAIQSGKITKTIKNIVCNM